MSNRAVESVREEYLDEDPEIPSQKYALLSFISPENVLQSKEKFFFEKFLTDYEIQFKIKSLEEFLGTTILGINRKIDEITDAFDKAGASSEQLDQLRSQRVPVEAFLEQYQTYLRKYKKEVTRVAIDESYKDFVFREGEKLEGEFHSTNNFQTTVRGMKVRGVFSNPKEAEARAKKLQRSDPVHNILLGEVGKWLPWDPSPNGVKDQVYAEDQLNSLMQAYKKNEENVENFYRDKGLKKPAAKIHGATGDDTEEAGTGEHAGLFDQTDLVLQRKMEALAKANATATAAAAAATNTIVTPESGNKEN
jgi:hypothetical protein